MKALRIIIFGLATSLIATSCLGGSGDTSPPPGDTVAIWGTAQIDGPCDGGAFPNDAEFRQMVCDVQNAELGLMGTGGEFDPAWGPRISQAIINYSNDRAGAMSDLQTVAAEINAATP